MPSFMRFYLVVNEFNANTWLSISELLKTISSNDSLSGSQILPTITIFYQSLELNSSESKRLVHSKYGREIKKNDKISIKDLTKSSILKDFVIIIRLKDGYYNFKDYLPFFLLYEKYKNISLGIDLNQLSNTRYINDIKFSLGQLLWRWRVDDRKILYNNELYVLADHLFYYIHEGPIKINSIIKQTHRGKFPADEKVILRKFSPFIEINQSSFEDLFSKPCSSHPLFRFVSSKFSMDDEEIKKIFTAKNDELIYSDLLMHMVIDFLSSDRFKENTSRIIYDQLADESIFTVYLFCMFLLRIIKTYTSKEQKQTLLDESNIKGYIYLIRSYSNGIREIAENIIDHTKAQHGYIYLVLRDSKEINNIYGIKDDVEIKYQLLQGSHLKEYLKNISGECDYILEIYAIDSNTIGIVDSYKSEYLAIHKKEDLSDISLRTFFDNDYYDFPENSRLEWRYLAHLGLKTFTKLNSENNGYLFVETNQDKLKKGLTAFSKGEKESSNYKFINEKIDKYFLDGTFYSIILPITKNVKSFQSAPIFYEVDTNEKFFEKYLNKDYNFYEVKFNDFYHVKAISKTEKIIEIGDSIVNLLPEPSSGNLLINYSEVRKSGNTINHLIKILAYVQLKKKIPHIILFNIPEYEIIQIKNSLNAITSSRTFWHHDFWLMLYDENGKPFIINGRHPSVCYNLNNYLSTFYGTTYNIEYKQSSKDALRNIQSSFFHPFEVLLKTEYNSQTPVTLFEHYLFKILNKIIDENENNENNYEIGFKLRNAHMKLGSKLHINNFYLAEHLFNNSFYAYRFAFIISREIIKKSIGTLKRKILIVGYGDYSEMLVNKIMKLLESNKLLQDRLLEYYLICKDIEELKFQNIDLLKESLISKNPAVDVDNIDYVVIVPIGSTLTTNSKVISALERNIKKYVAKNYKLEEDHILLNTTLLLVRDGSDDDSAFKEMSNFEKEYEWLNLDKVNRIIRTKKFNSKGIKFSIPLMGNWASPLECTKCFPSSISETEQNYSVFLNEEALFETNKTSVLPINILGYPRVNDFSLEEEKINRKRIEKFKGLIKYPHVERGRKHYLYYLDTEKYCESDKNKEEISIWLSSIKHFVLGDKRSILDIIVTVLHDSNIGFINLVNSIVFDGAALVIRLDLEQDFRDNIIIKYGFLNKITQPIRIHFVDDTISTGHNISGSKSLVYSIFHNLKKDVIIYSSIIVLLNRSSLFRQNDVIQIRKTYNEFNISHSQYFAFINLYVPPLKDTGNSCFVCNSEKRKINLSNQSVLDIMKSSFYEGSKKIKKRPYNNNEEFKEKNQYFERMLMIHDLYFLYTYKKTEKNNILSIYEYNLKDIGKKINFIKIISTPLFSYYKNIRKSAFKIILQNFDILLNKVSSKEKIELADINYLLVLIKQSAELSSNFIIRKLNIQRIWIFYKCYREKYNCLLELFGNTEILTLLETEYWKGDSHQPQIITDIFAGSIKSIFSNSDVRLLQKILLNYDRGSLFAIYDNIISFYIKYAQSIKSLLDIDEPRSFWFEYLIRTGEELNYYYKLENSSIEKIYPSIMPEFNPTNEIYLLGDELFGKKTTMQNTYREYFNILLIENNLILQNGFQKIIEEIEDSEFVHLLNDDLQSCEKIHAKIKNNLRDYTTLKYYYDSLTKYLSNNEFLIFESILTVKIYFRAIKNGKVDVKDIDITLSEIVKFLSINVFSSDIAWFEIKNYPIDNRTFAIGVYGISNDLEKPFEISESYYSRGLLHDKTHLWYNFNTDYKMISENCYERKNYKVKHALFFRFFGKKSIFENVKPESFGSIVFYFKREFTEKDWKKKKSIIKLFMNLKSEIENFLEDNFINDNLNSWILGKESDILIRRRYEKFTHNLGGESQALIRSIQFVDNEPSPNYPQLYKNAITIRSRIKIGHYFSELMQKKEIKKVYEGLTELSKIFHGTTNYLLMLDNLINYEDGNIDVAYKVNEDMVTDLNISDLQDFITEFILNFKKSKKIKDIARAISFTTDESEDGLKSFLIIETSGSILSITQNEIDNILASETQLGGSIGLFTINKYFKHVQNSCIDVKLNEGTGSFKITMPLRRNENG